MCTYIIHVLYLRLNDKFYWPVARNPQRKGAPAKSCPNRGKKGPAEPSTARVTTKGTGSNKNNIKKKHR